MRRVPGLARILALALVAPALAGCESLGGLFGPKDDPVLDEPADRIYNEGLYLLNVKRDTKGAAKRFEEVDRQHPYSEWARKSLIMSAYAYYEAGHTMIPSTRRGATSSFIPAVQMPPIAQFLIGSSYFDQIREVSRDQERTEKAISMLDEVVRKYPNTEYAVSAKRKIEQGRDQLAARECWSADITRAARLHGCGEPASKEVVTKYQTTRHVEEALLRLTEVYLALGVVSEAQTSAAVLGHNFPPTAAGTRTPMRC